MRGGAEEPGEWAAAEGTSRVCVRRRRDTQGGGGEENGEPVRRGALRHPGTGRLTSAEPPFSLCQPGASRHALRPEQGDQRRGRED